MLSAITGNYETLGNPAEADCVIGQSFGAAEHGPGYVNELLAGYIIDKAEDGLPLLLQSEIANSLASESRKPSLIIGGNPSTYIGGELDSWAVLLRARAYMEEHDLYRPLLVAQAFHVGRVSLQALKQGMEPIIPPGLPRQFDSESAQFWTRSQRLWVPRELVGLAYLKARNRM